MGVRKKTRHLMQKHRRTKGKISISKYFRKFSEGDTVVLKIEPAVRKGVFHPRFQGKAGVVKNKKGACYEIGIKDKGKSKTIIVHPIHMEKR